MFNSLRAHLHRLTAPKELPPAPVFPLSISPSAAASAIPIITLDEYTAAALREKAAEAAKVKSPVPMIVPNFDRHAAAALLEKTPIPPEHKATWHDFLNHSFSHPQHSAPVAAIPQLQPVQENKTMASHPSVLSEIKTGVKRFTHLTIMAGVAAEPAVKAFFPGVSDLFDAVITEAGKAEAIFAAADEQSGSGERKMALVLQSAESAFTSYAAKNGMPVQSQAATTAIANAAVAFLNAIEANKEAADGTVSVPA